MADDIALLVADIYEAAGALRKSGEAVAKTEGQTQARWQLLSVISGDATSVPRAARRLGVSRQGVQRIANNLVDDGLAQWRPNPDHRSSPLLALTATGRRVLSSITDRASAAQRSLTADIEAGDIRTARKVLQRLTAAVRQLE
ncbi:MarR family winged helix-turn-helix transcriptional regulator [Mycobacterium sp. Z3061]|uniref:MarR family winged helix-turn-helix transcriptional regulator n=1 Tax=Mycobacterium sp. Z3061 TaxID=3073562 RepID=UPI002873B813|nr:MarR family winged helix-turn-helix transcriptional regulator [Mycobacterium sp. Z3061]